MMKVHQMDANKNKKYNNALKHWRRQRNTNLCFTQYTYYTCNKVRGGSNRDMPLLKVTVLD